MAKRKPKPQRWSRKGRCPSCAVGCGSKHKSDCTFDYGTEASVVLKKKPILSRDALIEALNRMDEFASEATQDNDNGEAEQLEKDYNLLFEFISNVKIK